MTETNQRLEELRAEIRAERISWGELFELQALGEAGEIDPGDVELLEWAGVPEFPVHLSLPRGGTACGADGEAEAEHLATTCPRCIAIHDAVTAEPCE